MVWPYFFAKIGFLGVFRGFGQEKNGYPNRFSLIWVWWRNGSGCGDTC